MYSIKYLGKSRIEYLVFDDFCALNLNAVITRFNFNSNSLSVVLDEILPDYSKINLCGLASLCYRLKIRYGSEESFLLAKNIKAFFDKNYPAVQFCQNQIIFDGDCDLLPIKNLWSIDENASTIYCHKMLFDVLDMLGFTAAQFPDILTEESVDLWKVLPRDIVLELPLLTDYTLDKYHDFCEVFKC